ncbi:hypothetical protein QAD02_004579 [Eretmocerus hayati]|uniref:Uncharacterized protein n=1 Tax=Eretmocerus hayati TaxID=131215 RepID=A0ACC2NSV2_9HYME|nr:hypothetical protein QAD02_004579 [Eretmocerus hayati]
MSSPGEKHTLQPARLNFSSAEESDTSFRTAGSSPRGKTSDSDDATARKMPSSSSTPIGGKSSKKFNRPRLQDSNVKKKSQLFAAPTRSPIALRPRNGSGNVIAPRVSRIAGYFEHLSRMSNARKNQAECSKNSSIANSSGNTTNSNISNNSKDLILMSTISEAKATSSFTPVEKMPRTRNKSNKPGLVATVKSGTNTMSLQPSKTPASSSGIASPKAVSAIMKRRSVQGQTSMFRKTPAKPVRHIRTMFSPARAVRANPRTRANSAKSGSSLNSANIRDAKPMTRVVSRANTTIKTAKAIPRIIVTEDSFQDAQESP